MDVRQPTNATALKAVRTGTVSLLITDLTKAVAFSSAMPSANYTVSFEPGASVAMSFGAVNKTVNGFDVASLGVGVTLKYKAVED